MIHVALPAIGCDNKSFIGHYRYTTTIDDPAQHPNLSSQFMVNPVLGLLTPCMSEKFRDFKDQNPF